MASGCQHELWLVVSCNEVTAGSSNTHFNTAHGHTHTHTHTHTQQTEVTPLPLTLQPASVCCLGVCACSQWEESQELEFLIENSCFTLGQFKAFTYIFTRK